jgi:hypothetical protein
MSAPKRLLVEYEDGSTKEVDFANIDREMVDCLTKLGLCRAPAEVASSKHYLILRWKDGWQEVLGVNHDTVELLRYYVITRVEDRARLSVDVGEYWPRLFIIERTPREVKDLLIVSNDSTRVCQLEAELERWEGTFEAGGKKEYAKYDKANPRVPQEMGEAPDELSRLVDTVRNELSARAVLPEALLKMDQNGRMETYRDLAKALGFRAMERQEDVYGLVEFLVRHAS